MTLRERVHEIIFESDTPVGKWFDIALIVAILLSVFVVILATLPEVGGTPWAGRLYAVEWVFTILFTIEYVTRLMVVKRPLRYAGGMFGASLNCLTTAPSTRASGPTDLKNPSTLGARSSMKL